MRREIENLWGTVITHTQIEQLPLCIVRIFPVRETDVTDTNVARWLAIAPI